MRQILLAITLVLVTAVLASSQMLGTGEDVDTSSVTKTEVKQVTRKITSYNITLMGSASDKLRGWIELRDGAAYAGYIYLTDESPMPKDYLGSTYVVMHQRVAMLEALLLILRNEKNLQIRFSDSGSSELPVTFLEQVGSSNLDKPFLNKGKE